MMENILLWVVQTLDVIYLIVCAQMFYVAPSSVDNAVIRFLVSLEHLYCLFSAAAGCGSFLHLRVSECVRKTLRQRD